MTAPRPQFGRGVVDRMDPALAPAVVANVPVGLAIFASFTSQVGDGLKGQVTDSADAKSKAAQRWVDAVNRLGQHGAWHYLLVTDPGRLGQMLNAFTGAS